MCEHDLRDFSSFFLILFSGSRAFAPIVSWGTPRSAVVVKGYLDDLSSDLYGEVDEPDIEGQTHEATDAKSTDRVSNKRRDGFCSVIDS